jgi:uncharacterized protein (TIGR02569 family)
MAPPAHVLAAFGVDDATPLAGGQETSWRAGHLVIKPLDHEPDALEWLAGLYERLVFDRLRVASPIRALDGSLIVDGWTGWTFVAGTHAQRRWPEIIDAGETFHRALANLERPPFLDRRSDVWAIGDRVAWGELQLEQFAHAKHLMRLAGHLKPIDLPSQLVHGDLGGNVLFKPGLPPAIIDFSPLWRPPGFASAIVVADALVWEGADETILDGVSQIGDFPQLLLRALIFRIVADRHLRSGKPPRPDPEDPYLPAVELAASLAIRS